MCGGYEDREVQGGQRGMFISMGTAKRDVLMHIVCTSYVRRTLCVRDVLYMRRYEDQSASQREEGLFSWMETVSHSLSLWNSEKEF